ncbi:hypothetical protein PRK78_001831 [Emydomyces testavorans]|uniref:Indole-diterpene biosynthesis protein PaxU n=1 Tax=Emydomyces testavorans TaxID=2070801 RepID=A0AAF0DDQ5_9EURO|nr:hypothetical protein PRK78_001831 [Emydomyces testavorans]
MASNVKGATPSIFHSMAQLGPAIYLRDFPHTPKKHEKPLTIMLFFWMNAAHRTAAKYASEYSHLAPNARIISIFTSALDFFIRTSDTAQRRRIGPVLDAILSTEGIGDGNDGDRGRLYIHVFSNGGSITLNRVAAAYRDLTGKPLPVNALLIDSAPGKTSLAGAVRALSYSFPAFFLWRVMVFAFVWAWLLSSAFLGTLLRRKHPAHRLREELNDPGLISVGAERCYVYSKEDDLISWEHVEEHAGQARMKGWKVSREMFAGSPHVGHMRTDPQRYWKIVARLLKVTMG